MATKPKIPKITDDGLSPSERTRRQELGSAWIMRRALKDNQKYSKWEDITKDKKYAELGGPKGIYPQVTAEWLEVFFLQQKKMIEEFSNPKFTEFNREHGFMDFITKLVKDKYGISQKDTWDPADIWCIQNEKKVISDIQKIINTGGFTTIKELNTYLRTLFRERKVVGISLKKVSGKQAKYEEVNTKETEFKDTKHPNFTVQKMRVELSIKSGTKSPKSAGSEFLLKGIEGGKEAIFTIDIRAQSGSKYTFVKFESKSSLASKARLGKAKVEYVRNLFAQYKVPIAPSPRDYPLNLAEFMKRQEEFTEMFRTIKKNSIIETGINDEKEFVENMKTMFMNQQLGLPVTANSKCQQVAVFASLAKLTKKQLEEIGTKIVLAGAKKGDGEYGPYGKLY
jgi:hypothetical protein